MFHLVRDTPGEWGSPCGPSCPKGSQPFLLVVGVVVVWVAHRGYGCYPNLPPNSSVVWWQTEGPAQ